jgi:hypothetical protein
MKAAEFKKILKPLIEQTIKEVLSEEGMLSNIVSEVVSGISGQTTITEKRQSIDEEASHRKYEKQKQERIRRLNESSKVGAVFEGTKPLDDDTGHGALSNVPVGDKGVDISAIEKIANGKWKHLI